MNDTHPTTRLLRFSAAGALLLSCVFAKAQTGIGTFTPDRTVALDVVSSASNTNGPIRLQGLKVSGTDTLVLVTDATGRLRYRGVSTLFPAAASDPGLWQDNADNISPIGDRPVGIGTTNQLSGAILSVNGDATLQADSRLQFRDGANYIATAGSDKAWHFVGRRYVHFRDRTNASSILTVSTENSRVGINDGAPDVDFEVNGTQRMQGSHQLEFGNASNRIYRADDNDWRFVPRTDLNFMSRDNNVEIMTVDAKEERVGIKTDAPATDFEVNGTARMRGDQRLEFGNGNNRVYRPDDNDWRFVGRTQVNFMSRNNRVKVLTVDANEERVGINRANPATQLEVNGTQRMTGNQRLEFGNGNNRVYRQSDEDWRFIGRTRVNFMNRTNSRHVLTVDALDERVGVKTDDPQRDLEVRGTMRLTGDVGSADLDNDDVLVAAANGDIRRTPVAALLASGGAGDDLGDHTATENIQLDGEWLSNDGDDEGIRISNGGQVGIGVATPGKRLHVNGEVRLQGLPETPSDARILTQSVSGDVHYVTKANFKSDFGDNLGDHTATENIQLSDEWLSNDGGDEGIRIDDRGDVGIGVADPASELHVSSSPRGSATEVLIQHPRSGGDANLALFELNPDATFGFNIGYDGGDDELRIGRLNSATYWTMDRETGHLALGNNPSPSTSQRFMVNGDSRYNGDTRTNGTATFNGTARLTDDNRLYVGDDDNDLSIYRYTDFNQDDLEIQNDRGPIHLHAEVVDVTGPDVRGRLEPIAYFDAATQRVGIGETKDPTSTLHIDPNGNDDPLRIEDLDETPNRGRNYWVLLVNNNGVVYRSRNKVKGDNRFFTGGGTPNSAAADLTYDPNAPLARATPTNTEHGDNASVRSLQEENDLLRQQLSNFRDELDVLSRTVRQLQRGPSESTSPTASHTGHTHAH